MTGEPLPVAKGIGAEVVGGTINKTGSFSFRATKVGSATLLAQIIRMVEAAQGLPGFIGGRMTGGGFGGCTVNLVCEKNAENFVKVIAERYRKATEITPQVYLCTAEDGASELS